VTSTTESGAAGKSYNAWIGNDKCVKKLGRLRRAEESVLTLAVSVFSHHLWKDESLYWFEVHEGKRHKNVQKIGADMRHRRERHGAEKAQSRQGTEEKGHRGEKGPGEKAQRKGMGRKDTGWQGIEKWHGEKAQVKWHGEKWHS
jgi:hypothetical protein